MVDLAEAHGSTGASKVRTGLKWVRRDNLHQAIRRYVVADGNPYRSMTEGNVQNLTGSMFIYLFTDQWVRPTPHGHPGRWDVADETVRARPVQMVINVAVLTF